MKLLDVVASLPRFDGEDTIYATEPWTADSEVMVMCEPDAGGVPQAAAENEKRPLSLEEQCARLIHYAIHDA